MTKYFNVYELEVRLRKPTNYNCKQRALHNYLRLVDIVLVEKSRILCRSLLNPVISTTLEFLRANLALLLTNIDSQRSQLLIGFHKTDPPIPFLIHEDVRTPSRFPRHPINALSFYDRFFFNPFSDIAFIERVFEGKQDISRKTRKQRGRFRGTLGEGHRRRTLERATIVGAEPRDNGNKSRGRVRARRLVCPEKRGAQWVSLCAQRANKTAL